MANEDLDVLVAGILDGLGEHERASWVMTGVEPVDPDPPYAQLVDDIGELLDGIPANTDRHTHVDDARAEYGSDGKITKKAVVACWRIRAQCLADRIRSMIDEERA